MEGYNGFNAWPRSLHAALRTLTRAHLLAGLYAAGWLDSPAAPGEMAQVIVRCHEALHVVELLYGITASFAHSFGMYGCQ